MSYFRELPNLQYTARFADQSSNEDVVLVKNIFRRGKLRDDIAQYLTAFDYYYIQSDERPDQIADRIYGDANLDWVILITNNIINFNSEWPLVNDNFYNYMIEKYGSEEAVEETLFYETIEVRDEYERLVVPKELIVQPDIKDQFTTVSNKETPLDYELKRFPVPDELYPLTVTTNLGQYVEVWDRNDTTTNCSITDIRSNEIYEGRRQYFSFLKIHTNENTSDVYIGNTLSGWPSAWGGILNIYTIDNNIVNITLPSEIMNNNAVDITNDRKLYTIAAYEDTETNTKTPIFRFISID